MKHPLAYKATMGAVNGIYAAAFFVGLWGAGHYAYEAQSTPGRALFIGLMFMFAYQLASSITHTGRLITEDAE